MAPPAGPPRSAHPLRWRAVSTVGALVAAWGQLVLTSAASDGPPRVGVVALILGAGLFAVGTSYDRVDGPDLARPLRVVSPEAMFEERGALASGVIGLLAALALVYRLIEGSTSGWDLLIWLVALVAFAVPFAARLGRPRVASRRRLLEHVLLVSILVALFVALTTWDSRSWYYAAIGDEYAFYADALGILEDGVSRPFSQAGVYGVHPVLGSAYQALVMKLFGDDHAGWTLSSALSAAAAIPGVYLLGLALAGRGVAMVAATLFAFSHYVFAFTHIGYNNAHALAPSASAMAFFALGLRTGSAPLFYGAGLAAGLGFYAFFSARAILPIMVLFVLTRRDRRDALLALWPLGLGFALAAAPILAASGPSVVLRMLSEVPGGYNADVTGPVGQRLLGNVATNGLAFNYGAHVSHYVWGSLFDPVTAVLAILGIGLAVGRVGHEPYRLLLVWALLGWAATGLLSPYPHVAVTRLHFVVPPLVLLAGCAARDLWETLVPAGGAALRRGVGPAVLAALALVVLGLNARRFWSETPSQMHLSQEALAIGAMQSDACGGDPGRTTIVMRSPGGLLLPALESYAPRGPLPRVVSHRDLRSGRAWQGASARCIVFGNPNESEATQALDELRRRYPDGRERPFPARSGKASVTIFAVDAADPGAARGEYGPESPSESGDAS